MGRCSGEGAESRGEGEQPHRASIDSASWRTNATGRSTSGTSPPTRSPSCSAWLDEARAAGIELPEAATLATATADGAPSARMVLLKDAGERGLSFFTNYESRKGVELAENPRAALVLYWHALGRQVRVEGSVERLPVAESDAYFESRAARKSPVCRRVAPERGDRQPPGAGAGRSGAG